MTSTQKEEKLERELEELLKADLAMVFMVTGYDKETQIKFVQRLARVFQRIYIDYLIAEIEDQ
ncbi:MAG: hypothetical protein SOT68_00665 [Oscillospiraceae bacterium]|nr:hypothetical protein [Oscillospiraceae bacterium]